MALSPIEDRYLSALTAAQFPDMPVAETQQPVADATQFDGMQLAAAPTQVVSDAGGGRGSYAGFNPRMDAANKGQRDEMRAYDPTTRERIASFLQAGFEGLGMDRYKARQNAQTLIGGPSSNLPLDIGIADVVPFLGTALQTEEAVRMGGEAVESAKAGELGTAALQAGGAALGLVPGAAGTIKAAKALPQNLPVGMSTQAIGGMDGVLTPPPNVVSTRPLNIVQPGPKLTKVVTEDQVNTTNFKTWFGDWQAAPETASKVVDETGAPLAVFHGTARPDRVGVNFRKSRATSGPMSFFTDDPEIASGYAKGKQDTSLAYEETDYANWFKKKDGRSMVNLDQAGARMSAQEKQDVIAKLRDINMTDDGEIVYQPGGGTIMPDSSFDFYLQREAKGNPLKLAKQLWLESGTLYNDEEKFAKVLQLAGVKGFDADFPNASYPAVYKVFLDIKKPLDTATITSEFVADLEAAASRIRKKAARGGADVWDKNTIPPKEWVQRLKDDLQNGTTHAWTSIPDWVTDRLKASGFDGIKDTGGKRGGVSHTVWIPFEETQVKSAMGNIGTFDPSKKNILRGAGAGGTAAGTATMQDKEQQ